MTSRVVAWTESVALFAALYVGLPAAGIVLDRLLGWTPLPPGVRWVGILPFSVGAVGIALCFATFARVGRGTPNPLRPPRTLVTTGPFAWTRNPIILSHAMASGGVAFMVGSPAALVIVLALGVPVQFIVRHEERTLERRYADEYDAYRKAVPRWIPRRPRQSR